MERIREQRTSGLSKDKLRAWGMVFAAMGIVGKGIFQTRLLGMNGLSAQQLLEAMNSSDTMMIYATIALVMQVMETCAVPIFAYLLVDGFRHTSDFMKYVLRVAGVAVISELPYNLCMGGKLLDLSSRNPVFGLVLGLIVLYFFERYAGKKLQNVLIKLMVAVAAMVWTSMLSIQYGLCTVIIVCALWIFRKKPMTQNLFGATATIICSLSSPLFLAAPMSFLAIHFYNGEKGEENRVLNYCMYPVVLLAVGIAGFFLV